MPVLHLFTFCDSESNFGESSSEAGLPMISSLSLQQHTHTHGLSASTDLGHCLGRGTVVAIWTGCHRSKFV